MGARILNFVYKKSLVHSRHGGTDKNNEVLIPYFIDIFILNVMWYILTLVSVFKQRVFAPRTEGGGGSRVFAPRTEGGG